MKIRIHFFALAFAVCWLLPSAPLAETKKLMPPLEEVVVQQWIGISQEPPYGVYRLVIKKDGTGRLCVHEGVPRVWEISRWSLKGSQVYFTLLPNKDVKGEFAIHGVIPTDGAAFTIRARWRNQDDLPEWTVLLFPESRIVPAMVEVGVSPR